MPRRRSILLNGLRLVVTVPGPLLWTYALNLGLAFLFSIKLHAQFSSILDHSLAAERLNSAFDLGTISGVGLRLSYGAPSVGGSSKVAMRASVDLPQPDSPTMPSVSPRSTW